MTCRLLFELLIFQVAISLVIAQNTTVTSFEDTIVQNTTSSTSQTPIGSTTPSVNRILSSTTTLKIILPGSDPRTAFAEDGTKAECKKPVSSCELLQKKTCLGSSLPYSYTSLALINDSRTQADVENMLALWSGLRHAPKCWEVVQPFLCAVYMPECNASGRFVYLPGKEMCAVTREPCRIVESTRGWPSFLQCDNEHFVKGCTVSLMRLIGNVR